MSERVINTERSADLVTHKIFVAGDELPQRYHVINIVVEKEIFRIPSATIILQDGDISAQDFELSNSDLFIPGKEIEIKAGYHSQESIIFRGIVIKHSLKIRRGHSYLIVECKDKAVKMTVGRKSKYFYDSKDSEIIEEIINSYALSKEVESTDTSNKEIVQYNVTDWDFMVSRMQANGKVCIVDDGKIIIKKPDINQEPVETITYGATLLDFDAEIDARNQFQKVTTYGWNEADQEYMETEADSPDLELNGNLSSDDLAQVIGLDNLQLRNGNGNNSALSGWANARKLFNQLSKTRGRVRFQGIPSVKPNCLLLLKGVGNRFNGNIYISACRHEISEGNWTIDAQFGISPKWFTETFEINELPASGLTSAVNGLQIGVVIGLENDPENSGRIAIKLPVVDSQGEGIWARVATLDAGENRGSFFLPEPGDEIIVGFLNDDPDRPIVLGMLNSSAKPPPLTAKDENHEKGFVTRSEIRFIFNDEKKSVTIETPGGKKAVLDDDAGAIRFEDENGNNIAIDSSGITIDSKGDIKIKATGNISIEGMNVNTKANAQFKAEGSAGAEVSSGAVSVIKGSVVQIN
ncbi:MAG: type VI secretion system tip protein VgrG [Fermentimonas sp.]|nr:type VI secretion system tip protein VgrG [Fermentimonas sp.]